jgi:LuxR family maltose regulon positive regulatory protein
MDRHVSTSPGEVIREDLLNLLAQSESVPLTLLLAPPGSGKSTLLKHWQQRPGNYAKVYVPHALREAQPDLFLHRLTEAVTARFASFDHAWRERLDKGKANSPLALGEELARALERLEERVCLIFDDYQHNTVPDLLLIMTALLEHLPQSVRVVIASSQQPDLPLSRLRLENRLLHIDRQALRFSVQEIKAFNLLLGAGVLEDETARALQEITEGWVTGVKVALQSRARQTGQTAVRFNGDQPQIAEYFAQVVLQSLSPACRDFLMCTALFERFNGEACDQMLQRSGSALLLEHLAGQQVFMLPIDQHPGWFRYQTLFREFLLHRLAIEQPECIGLLNGRAARYFLTRDDPEHALRHARGSGDNVLFRDVLAICCARWACTGHVSRILEWLSAMPDDELLQDKRLLVPLIDALILSRRFHQAGYYLDQAAQTEIDPACLHCLKLTLQLFQLDREFTLEPGWQALLEPQVAIEVRARMLIINAYHHLLGGRLAASLRFASQAKELLAQSGWVFLESYADLIIALCQRNAGQVSQARKVVCMDFQRTDSASPAWVNRATAMVVALNEQNQLDAAQELCEKLLSRINASSATEAIATVYIILSRLLHRGQSPERASRLLEQLSSILQLGNYARFAAQVIQEQLRQAFLSGRVLLMDDLARRHRLDGLLAEGYWEVAKEYDESWERLGLAAVYWLVAKGGHGRALRVLSVLAKSLRQSEMRGRALIVDANLLVLNAQNLDKNAQREALLRLVEEYGVANITRSVFDEAPGFGEGVFGLMRSGMLDIPERYQQLYAEFLAPDQPAQRLSAPGFASLLTDKEVEIFECLLRGLSNTQISTHTGIALTTTKWHLKNIYSKLNVANRTEAILSVRTRPIS